MSTPILHIKDAYFFEVPKFLWPRRGEKAADFPDVWIQLDDQFQLHQAEELVGQLTGFGVAVNGHDLIEQWLHWQHADHGNGGRPLATYLEIRYRDLSAGYERWSLNPDHAGQSMVEYAQQSRPDDLWLARLYTNAAKLSQWKEAVAEASSIEAIQAFAKTANWSEEKIAGYNKALSGKILIPQPLGRLRNLHEPASGFCVSKFMVLEVVAAMLIVLAFNWLAKRIVTGERPRGRIWNLLESFLLFVRNEIARPVMGQKDGDRFTPILWTIFHFILVMNLLGMLPWAGAPTGSFSVTTGMALLTFGIGMTFGVKKFGFIGWVLNQAPSMDLPWWIAFLIKPLVLVIEILGLLIKHCVLAIRLMGNMVAGHVVLLGIMSMAVGAAGMAVWTGVSVWPWLGAASATLLGSVLFSVLELFVAFLQAYIFTFLSALFINAATHHH